MNLRIVSAALKQIISSSRRETAALTNFYQSFSLSRYAEQISRAFYYFLHFILPIKLQPMHSSRKTGTERSRKKSNARCGGNHSERRKIKLNGARRRTF